MEYARVESGTVIERRDLDSLPAHKAHLWRPVVYQGQGDLSDIVIEADQVRVVRSGVPVEQVKAALLVKLDDDAERVRLRYITPGAGMAMTYNEKFAQAQGVNAIGKEAANAMSQQEREAQFPTLSASVGLEAATLWDCAQLVLQKYAQFAALSLFIERTRLSGKKAIAEAQTADAAKAAYEAIKWTP